MEQRTTDDQDVEEKLADPFSTKDITTDTKNGPSAENGDNIVDVFLYNTTTVCASIWLDF